MALKIDVKTEATVTKTFSAIITEEAIKEALGIPVKAEIVFCIPGGADWSNTELELGDRLKVSWQETEK